MRASEGQSSWSCSPTTAWTSTSSSRGGSAASMSFLGGHTHDAVPQPVLVKNDLGYTLVTNAGSNGKFLGILDLQVDGGRITGYQYRLAPVFSNLLEPDREMDAHIKKVRAPYEKQLARAACDDRGSPVTAATTSTVPSTRSSWMR